MNREELLDVWLRGKWSVLLPMVVLLLVALVPQVAFRLREGQSGSGSYFSINPDETAYLAYVNALKDGRPRKSDPYSGRDDREGAQQPESIFSIQFLPGYALALPARVLGISVQRTFAILIVLVAICAAAAIYVLILSISKDAGVSAVGSIFVLCFGSLRYAPVVTRFQANGHAQYFPFLRGYQPSFAFPFFILFVIVAWLLLRTNDARKKIVGGLVAAGIFVLLLFSYFYLWTAALAWLALITILWLIAKNDPRKNLIALAVFGAIATVGCIPYWQLLSHRASSTDAFQVVNLSHRPDLLRASEIIGLLVAAAVAYFAQRGLVNLRAPEVLLNLSLALLPFVVFNQQVLTGYSIQPIHYELFVANYAALIAAMLTVAALLRTQRPRLRSRAVLVIGICAIGYGAVETTYAMRGRFEVNRLRDAVRPAALRLAQTSGTERNAVVLVPNLVQADVLSADAPQPVLWAPHMRSFPGVDRTEEQARYSTQLYYTGVDPKMFESLLRETKTVPSVIFGWERVNRGLGQSDPISEDEIKLAVRAYSAYVATFDRARAAGIPLTFVIAAPGDNLANLDRWYLRDHGQPAGKLMLYRVTLRE